MTEVHGLAVEPVSNARLVDQMCSVQPGLLPAQAAAALRALQTMYMTVHPQETGCTATGINGRRDLCSAGTRGFSHGASLCSLLAGHEDDWHQDARGNRWRGLPRRP